MLKDPEVRKAYDALELAHQIARARIMRGMTQEELAQKTGMRQSTIARLEVGRTEPRASTLAKIADALNYKLSITFEPCDEGAA
ncbi:MAG: helix-turn-helix domain-containing protein [Anaerolineae bacterium]